MRIVFIGTGAIGVPSLSALLRWPKGQLVGVVTQPDRPVGRDQRVEAPPIKRAVAGMIVPILQPEKIRSAEAVAGLETMTPDVIVVMAYGQILPKGVLEIPRLACLNLHASLLPKFRGAAPIQAAIAAGENETGITVIYMDEGLDTGDILLQEKLPILPNETGGSLHDRLAELASRALLSALEKIAAGSAPRTPQDSSRATYAPKLTREEGWIDWNQPAEAIERQIRAFDPWPGASARLNDGSGKSRRLKIFRATVLARDLGEPGAVRICGDELLVATGLGALRLEEVQLEGKRRMPGSEFLRGFSSQSLHF